jgi:hypothetical protein
MFEDVGVLAPAEYDAYVIACLETQFGAEYPDAADFVADEHQSLLDHRARLLSLGAAHLEAAAAAGRDAARAEAWRARELAAFARSRPAAMFDRASGAVGEASAMLGVSGRAASLLLVEAVTLVEGLPGTLAALSAGDISPAQARAMVELVGPVSTPGKRAAVEAAVLPLAAQQTAPALRACV